ncbi:MAG: hypothetical protein F6K42_25360 [Leptolyngbya sp. SIO1D8]|nr:hypothetical protein [Leptolyngbya sp. SIO1D8]
MRSDVPDFQTQLNNEAMVEDAVNVVPFVLAAPHHASSYSMPKSALEELSEEQCDAIIGGIQPSNRMIKGSGSDA